MLFGTVGTPLSTPKNPGGSVGAIRRLRELNLDALELGWVQSVRVSEEKCAETKAESSKENISLSVHAPYFINLNADDEEWPKSRKRLMDAAYFGNLAGATDIIFHPGSYFELPPTEVLKIAIPRLRNCVAELHTANNPVVLRPETMGKSSMLGSLEDTLIMARDISGVLPCLDFAHLHARPGDGSINSYEDWINIFQRYSETLGVEALGHLHIHLSGIEYTTKGEKKHLPIRESDLKIQELFKALKDLNCGGRVLCESPLLEEDALFMQELWQN